MINLTKGSSINLKKNDKNLEKIYVGVNWGKIITKKSSFFGFVNEESSENVDLDASAALFDVNGKLLEKIYFSNRISNDGSIKHSGDDTVGDDSDDNNDNETISINLTKVSPNIDKIIFFLNSYKGQDFDTVPYSKIRILDNTDNKNEVFAQFNLSAEKDFKNKVSMVMGKAVRESNGWKFTTIGEATNTRRIEDTIELIQKKYL